MTLRAQNGFEDDCVLEVQLHDLRTGVNLTDTIFGSEDAVWWVWSRTAQLLADTGFALGWRTDAHYAGNVDHPELLKQAIYRWAMQ